jgi:colicin import membrane protein
VKIKTLLITLSLIATASVWADDEEKARELRDRNLKRMQGMAVQGSFAPKNDWPSYSEQIRNAIKQNILYKQNPNDRKLDLQTIVLVECEENGLIKSRKILKSSGSGAWDASVLNALDKTQRLPTDSTGKAPPVLEIRFKPFD